MPMHYVQAPIVATEYNPKPWIFLAGGITGCPGWQSEVKKALSDIEQDITLINPRRDDFDVTNPDESLNQIRWERRHLNRCELISFWFAKETIQPIALFELGRFVDTPQSLVIGIHPEYPRRMDVEIQVTLARPDFRFAYSLSFLVAGIKTWIDTRADMVERGMIK